MERSDYAGFWDRAFGDGVDGAITFAIAAGVKLAVDRSIQIETSVLTAEVGTTDLAVFAWFVWNLTYLVGKTGQSWGRRVADVKVVDGNGKPIGFWRALLRNLFAATISAPSLYVGFLWVAWDPAKQAWHDKVFGTYVVRTGAS